MPSKQVDTFFDLHEGTGILMLPGVWDVASARLFAHEGFPALGTTSTGICWSIGRENGWSAFLEASRRIAAAVDIPVSFDIEAGFADMPEQVQRHAAQVIDAGACGINIEDGFAGGALTDPQHHAEKIVAIRELAPTRTLFINARTDVFLGGPNDLGDAIKRCQHYVEAGADGVFVPGLTDERDISVLVREVPAPVNVYALPGVPSPAGLSKLGVKRISLGCGPQQSALAHLQNVARRLDPQTDYSVFTENWMDFAAAEDLFVKEDGAP